MMKECGFGRWEKLDVQLAVEEYSTNIVLHAYEDLAGTFRVSPG